MKTISFFVLFILFSASILYADDKNDLITKYHLVFLIKQPVIIKDTEANRWANKLRGQLLNKSISSEKFENTINLFIPESNLGQSTAPINTNTCWLISLDGCLSLIEDCASDISFEWDGRCNNDKIEGKGILTIFKNKENYGIYQGEFKSGKRFGHGIFTRKDGYYFDGTFKNGLANGYCKSVWPDGEKFEGMYMNGIRHGKGVYKFANSNKDIGNWVNGQFE